jgi:hypothetical protein
MWRSSTHNEGTAAQHVIDHAADFGNRAAALAKAAHGFEIFTSTTRSGGGDDDDRRAQSGNRTHDLRITREIRAVRVVLDCAV